MARLKNMCVVLLMVILIVACGGRTERQGGQGPGGSRGQAGGEGGGGGRGGLRPREGRGSAARQAVHRRAGAPRKVREAADRELPWWMVRGTAASKLTGKNLKEFMNTLKPSDNETSSNKSFFFTFCAGGGGGAAQGAGTCGSQRQA